MFQVADLLWGGVRCLGGEKLWKWQETFPFQPFAVGTKGVEVKTVPSAPILFIYRVNLSFRSSLSILSHVLSLLSACLPLVPTSLSAPTLFVCLSLSFRLSAFPYVSLSVCLPPSLSVHNILCLRICTYGIRLPLQSWNTSR